jgi:hypothetical protein
MKMILSMPNITSNKIKEIKGTINSLIFFLQN